jgi:hypothetical protein
MFEYIDHLYTQATEIAACIMVVTTCVLIMYLLFRLVPIIEHLLYKDSTEDTVIIDNKQIHINIKNNTYEIHSNKIRKLFWWAIAGSYLVGILIGYSIILVPPLMIVAILYVRKLLKSGPIKAFRGLLKIASPK